KTNVKPEKKKNKMQRTRYMLQQNQQQQQQQQIISASTSTAAQMFGQKTSRRQQQQQSQAATTRASSSHNSQKQKNQQHRRRSNVTQASSSRASNSIPKSNHAVQHYQQQQLSVGPEFSIDLGELTQTPRRRVSAVPGSSLRLYRLLRRALGILTCFLAVADLAIGVSDIVIGASIVSRSQTWICSTTSAGASVLASGVTGCLFCLSIVATQWLATGNTVAHSGITAAIMLISLSHTCSALPRMRYSYLASDCTPKATAYLWLTSLGRLLTLLTCGFYYGLLNYYVCKFGEDNSSLNGGGGGGSRNRSRDQKK
ncbi:hypothetical protein BOX15_Mlig010003g1, partial [Macrostomum lignano]